MRREPIESRKAALVKLLRKADFALRKQYWVAGTSIGFGKLILDETEKWAKVVKFSGAKPE